MDDRALRRLRWLGGVFIWLGFATGILSLLLAIPNVGSVNGLLLSVAGAIEVTARTAGLGALLVLLVELIRTLSNPRATSSSQNEAS